MSTNAKLNELFRKKLMTPYFLGDTTLMLDQKINRRGIRAEMARATSEYITHLMGRGARMQAMLSGAALSP